MNDLTRHLSSLLAAGALFITSPSVVGAPYTPMATVSGRTIPIQATVTHLVPGEEPKELLRENGNTTFNVPDPCKTGEKLIVRPRLASVYNVLEVECQDERFTIPNLEVRRGIAVDRK